jgi:hypothetical protein
MAALFKFFRLDVWKAVNQQHANFDNDQRRAGIRRTVLIVGAIALAIFVLFFVKQGIWH